MKADRAPALVKERVLFGRLDGERLDVAGAEVVHEKFGRDEVLERLDSVALIAFGNLGEEKLHVFHVPTAKLRIASTEVKKKSGSPQKM